MNEALLTFLVGAFLVFLAALFLPGPRRAKRDGACALLLVAGQVMMGGVAAHEVFGYPLWWSWLIPLIPFVGALLGAFYHTARAMNQEKSQASEGETKKSSANPPPSVGIPIHVTLKPGQTPDDVLADIRGRGPSQ